MDETALGERRHRLADVLRDCESVCIGYSGGVDSVFLAAESVAVLGRGRVLAVTGRSPAYPDVQHAMALECVDRFDIPHLEVATRELEDPRYAANPGNRCYYCKSELWDRVGEVARERGLRTVVDGSNADDAIDRRPGHRAGLEREVRSPLREAGLGKDTIRRLSRRLGLPTWDQPASPCLASRLVHGLGVTPARLKQVERAEEILRAGGFSELRVRHHGDAARIELAAEDMESGLPTLVGLAAAIAELGFDRVLLDVEGYRRGSVGAPLVRLRPTAADRPLAAVRRLLRTAGLAGTVTAAGHDGAVASVREEPAVWPRLAELAPRVRARGFRWVGLELGGRMGTDR